jgi:biopolymer transport protein ExbD
MIQNPEPDGGVAVELTPIIDMVFLLLIFFLIATTFHQTEREMQIALPSAAAASPISTTLREIIVNVDAEGTVIVSGRRMEIDDLGALIAEAVERNPDQKVTVRGDRGTSYANIVRVLDACKGNGVREPYLDTVMTGAGGS